MRTLAILVALAIVAYTHAAATVRFVNLVPAEQTFKSLKQAQDSTPFGLGQFNPNQVKPWDRFPYHHTLNQEVKAAERVGLQYFPPRSSLKQPTVVWTESLASMMFMSTLGVTPNDLYVGTHAAPYYYRNAVPPLRAYHAATADESVVEDRITRKVNAADGSADATDTGACTAKPASYDCYDQSSLKADGIAGTLSFAAGEYVLRAYGVRGGKTAVRMPNQATSPTEFPGSETSFTFQDNKLYTIIATGQWNYAATTSGLDDVKLTLLEESTERTSFGKAAIRFFNGIATQKTDGVRTPIDVYRGSNVPSADRIVESLAFGSVSSYLEVDPGQHVFPIANQQDTAISSGTSGSHVTARLPAGARVTSFCAVTDEQAQQIFCRMIPTRVVAYVRLVSDTLYMPSLVQGKFGPQKVSETSLSVWQSYDYAAPEFVQEQYSISSHMGENGLFQVIPPVAPGTVSGYGEVLVPLFVMDSATSPTIGFSCGESVNAANGHSCSNLGFDQAVTPETDGQQAGRNNFDLVAAPKFSARFKRVNLFVKTDSLATIAGRITASAVAGHVPSQVNDLNANNAAGYNARFTTVDGLINGGAFIDRYMEPGEYYSMYIKPCDRTYSTTGAGGTKCPYVLEAGQAGTEQTNGLPTLMPTPSAFLMGWSRDIDSVEVTNVVGATDTKIQFTSIDAQDFNGNIELTSLSANAPSSQPILLPTFSKEWGANQFTHTGYKDSAFQLIATNNRDGVASVRPRAWGKMNAWTVIPEGRYSYTWTRIGNINSACTETFPTTTPITLKGGMRYTVYVLNTYKCTIDNSVSALSVVVAPVESAYDQVATPVNNFFSAASSVSASVSMLLAALIAVLALVC